MKDEVTSLPIVSWLFALVVFTIGVLNLLLIYPVPGVAFLLLSLVYVPSVNSILKGRFGFSIPPVVKIILGVSDLGEMID